MADDTLKKFLIELGWKLDESSQKKTDDAVKKSTDIVIKFGAAMTAVAAELGFAVERVATQFQNLYFSAQRTGATVDELKNFAFGASQVGVSAEEATAAIEGFAQQMKLNPGYESFLNLLGVQTRVNGKMRDMKDIAMDAVDKWRHMDFYIAAGQAEMFGISPKTLQQLENHYDDMIANMASRKKRLADAGLDENALGVSSDHFMRDLGQLKDDLGIFGELVAKDLIDPADKAVVALDGVVQAINRLDKETGGLSTIAIAGPGGMLAAILSWKTFAVIFRAAARSLGLQAVKTAETVAATETAVAAEAAEVTTAIEAGTTTIGTAIGTSAVAAIIGGTAAIGAALAAVIWALFKSPEYSKLPVAPDQAPGEGSIAVPDDAPGPDFDPKKLPPDSPLRELMPQDVPVSKLPGAVTVPLPPLTQPALPAQTPPSLPSDAAQSSQSEPVPQAPAASENGGLVQRALDKLRGFGWSREQASGIVANLETESSLRPDAEGDLDKRTGQYTAYGIGQWHKARQDEFARWAGHDIHGSSFEEQLAFLNYEMTQGLERFAGRMLKKTTTAADAGAAVSKWYERPADQIGEMMRRAGEATRLLSDASLSQHYAMSNVPASILNQGDRSSVVNNTQHVKINVQGDNADAIGRVVAGAQSRTWGDVIRNMSPVLS